MPGSIMISTELGKRKINGFATGYGISGTDVRDSDCASTVWKGSEDNRGKQTTASTKMATDATKPFFINFSPFEIAMHLLLGILHT